MKSDPETFITAFKETIQNFERINAKKELKEQLANPVQIATEGRVVFGPQQAPVTIVEFSDFQCPYCAKASYRVKSLIAKYKGQVRLVYKHFPLSFHPFAKPASIHYEAVAMISPEKARQFHDKIFDNFSDYAKLSSKKEIQLALNKIMTKINVNISSVRKNLAKATSVVEEDLAEAESLGVRGTPSFYVNGVFAKGDLDSLITHFLKK